MNRAKEIFGFDDKWLVIIGIPVTTLITTAMMFGDILVSDPRFFFTACNGVGFVYTTIFWLVFRQVVLFFAERYPDPKDFAKRILFQSLVVLVLYVLIKRILDPWLHGYFETRIQNELQHDIAMTIGSLLVTFLVLTIYVTAGFYHQLQKTMVEKERLLKENMQSQLETLKNQVNPHFFFNSLNTLAYLIPENPVKAENFVQKLSKAYRYILEIRERELTTVAEELGFLDSYNCLLNERFGENLRCKYCRFRCKCCSRTPSSTTWCPPSTPCTSRFLRKRATGWSSGTTSNPRNRTNRPRKLDWRTSKAAIGSSRKWKWK
ncbi:MAG: histidine kinase [Saprospiraceae bacterium]|nr:histidine kinase [Saprospiraceae bacterium]